MKSVLVLGWVMSTAGHIFVDRGRSEKAMASLRESKLSLIKNPRSVLLFPEGTRTLNGILGDFKKGGLLLSVETGISIVPVAFVGTYQLLPKGSWKMNSNSIEIRIGNPIPSGLYSKQTRADLAKYVKSKVEDLLKKYK